MSLDDKRAACAARRQLNDRVMAVGTDGSRVAARRSVNSPPMGTLDNFFSRLDKRSTAIRAT